MRKLMVIPMAGLLVLAVAAPVAAGPNVSNSSGTATVAEAYWGSAQNGVQSSGYISVTREGKGEAFAHFERSTGAYVLCEGGEFEGFVGTLMYGFGPATLTVGTNSTTASASATVESFSFAVDECDGMWDEQPGDAFDISLDLTAEGPTLRSTSRESFHLPQEFNERYSYRAAFRRATGSATIDGATLGVDGQIGKVSWSSHVN